jgi:hypothetical protein
MKIRTVVAVSLFALTAVTASPSAANAPTPKTTTLKIVVTGCEGCTIGWQRALASDTSVAPKRPRFLDGESKKVSGGQVTFTIPTKSTQGVSFTISAPWEGFTDYVTNIVLGSDSLAGTNAAPVGTKMSTAQAKKRQEGSPCWNGTTKAKTVIYVSVAKIRVKDPKATAPLAWASPTVSTILPGLNGGDSPPVSLTRGTIGNQDAFYC